MKHVPTIAENAFVESLIDRIDSVPLAEMMKAAESLTLLGFGPLVTYSRKVFIPLTELCRDVCHYCTFAKSPRLVPAGLSQSGSGAGDCAGGKSSRMPGGLVHFG